MVNNYDKYLKSSKWKDKRQAVLNYRGNLCKVCGSTEQIEIHHKKYRKSDGRSILGREQIGDLFPLCNKCHHIWHRYHGTHINKSKINKVKILVNLGYPLERAIEMLTDTEFSNWTIKFNRATPEGKEKMMEWAVYKAKLKHEFKIVGNYPKSIREIKDLYTKLSTK